MFLSLSVGALPPPARSLSLFSPALILTLVMPFVCPAMRSLGGAIAFILTAMARVKLRIPDSDLSCHTFGSPAVMAHSGSEGSDAVCRTLGLKPSTIKHFCLDDDPVPRLLLAVDPAYSLVGTWPPSACRHGLIYV